MRGERLVGRDCPPELPFPPGNSRQAGDDGLAGAAEHPDEVKVARSDALNDRRVPVEDSKTSTASMVAAASPRVGVEFAQ